MVAAKQGYRFRERERTLDFRHGFSPIPAERTPESEPAPKRSKDALPALDKGGILLLLILAGIVGIGMLIASAWMNSIQYDINQTVKATEAVYKEIEQLTVRIEKGTGISVIEQRATDELGMIYPTAEQMVYIEGDPPQMNDFAQYIKENAYQLW